MTDKNSIVNQTGGGFFGGSFFSSVSSSVTAFSQTIQTKGLPELNKRFNELQQRARELPSQFANLQSDLESERNMFVQNKKMDEKHGTVHQSKGSVPVAPWEGYHGYEKEMKQAILDISKDERNLLISPPDDTNFQFDLNAYSQSAQAVLKEDKQLAHLRFVLVPQQVTEPMFWRNYFYRVTIVKQTILSNPPSNEPVKANDDVLFDFKDEVSDNEEEEEEVASSKDSIVVVEKKEDTPISSSKSDENYEGMEEWEIELRKAAI